MTCETPAAIRRQKPTGTSNLAGQRIRPPELDDISCVCQDSQNMGQPSTMIISAAGNRKNSMPNTSILICVRLVSRCDNTSTRTCPFFSSV